MNALVTSPITSESRLFTDPAQLLVVFTSLFPVESRTGVDFFTSMTIVLARPSEAEVRKQIRDMRKTVRKIASTRASARAYLRKHGFITKSNQLTKRYR